MYNDHKIVLGIAPVRRDVFPEPDDAIRLRKEMLPKLVEMAESVGNTTTVGIDWLNEEGLLVENEDVPKVAKYFRDNGVNALFVPHFNFGQEEAVVKLAKELNVPVLVWGPRDETPPQGYGADGGFLWRQTDTQCGLFATGKALNRCKIPFTYIENCRIDDPILRKGIEDFLAVADVVYTFKNIRIGQFSVRPRQFLSVRINENDLLTRFGVDVVTLNMTEVFKRIHKLLEDPTEEVKVIDAEINANIVCKIPKEKVTAIAATEVAFMELAKRYNLDAIACECWDNFQAEFGIRPCFIFGDLTDRGLSVACEVDVHGAISTALLRAAARGKKAPFLADITIRHPENDNAELLWHCGPFPKSLAKDGCEKWIVDGHGEWEIKGGPVTLVRFDEQNGTYYLFADEAKGCEGPRTEGNYLWVEVDNWPRWERKFVCGPYIHHIGGIHGNYVHIFKEAIKYMGDIVLDNSHM